MHYLTPTADNDAQTAAMAAQGIYTDVKTEVGQIIVAKVETAKVDSLVENGDGSLDKLIRKES